MSSLTALRFFAVLIMALMLTACGEDIGGGTLSVSYTVTARADTGGVIEPSSKSVKEGETAQFTITPNPGYSINTVTGDCTGTFDVDTNIYTTGKISSSCTVYASFSLNYYTVTATAGPNGEITPAGYSNVVYTDSKAFTVTPALGYGIANVTGCNGVLSGETYTISHITEDCEVSATFGIPRTIGGSVTGLIENSTIVLRNNGGDPLTVPVDGDFTFTTPVADTGNYDVTIATQPVGQECEVTNGSGTVSGANIINVVVGNCIDVLPPAPVVNLTYDIKELQFSWNAMGGARYYKLFEDPNGVSGYTQIGGGDLISITGINHEIALHHRINARYQLEACNDAGCTGSGEIFLADHLVPAIGYFKASNTGAGDYFGWSVALSGDGNTLAVGAPQEDATDDTATNSGAVYIFSRTETGWSQQAYLKASNTRANDEFGTSLSLSYNGDTLAVGAHKAYTEPSGQNQQGAVYIFTRTGTAWTEQAYFKGWNTGDGDRFGISVALSDDGNTLAVGADNEDSDFVGVHSPEGLTDNELASNSGAVHLFTRTGATWTQQAFVKASNTGAEDYFGSSVALSGDGSTLAVGAYYEQSSATGINGDEGDSKVDFNNSGAVYVFTHSIDAWSQQAYVKASNTGLDDLFGYSVALSVDGNTLAVGAYQEDSPATGINGVETETLVDKATDSGAIYVFTRADSQWSQQAYVKASNTGSYDNFGWSVALSADGDTLVVGAYQEDSSTTGINGDETLDSTNTGAAYVFTRSDTEGWSQLAYIKASNTGDKDFFGQSVAISGDGNTIAVGANREDSAAPGVDGVQTDDPAITDSGAVYLY